MVTPPICTSIERMPASIQNTVTPFAERFWNRAAHGFDAVPGNRFDRTGLVKVRITPATMARALEYLLSVFTNVMEASRQFRLNSSAKRLQIPLAGVVLEFMFQPIRYGEAWACCLSGSAQYRLSGV